MQHPSRIFVDEGVYDVSGFLVINWQHWILHQPNHVHKIHPEGPKD